MSELNLGQFLESCVWIAFMACPLFLGYLFAKKRLTKSRFIRFLAVLTIATLSSMVPFGPLGLFMGFPSVLLASILISCFLDKEDRHESHEEG